MTTPDDLVQSALALLEKDQLSGAETFCRQALKSQPDHIPALVVLGLTLHSASRFGEAETVFEELVRREPTEAIHWMNLGTARRRTGKFDLALAAYMHASQLGCATADFFYNVGLTHLDRYDFEAARAVLKQAMTLAPQDAEIRFEYAKACYESLNAEEAIAALEGWQNLEGLGPEIVANIGHKLMNLGESGHAEQAVQTLLASRDLDPRASLTLIQILERTNRLTDARAMLDKLVQHPLAAKVRTELAPVQGQLAQRESRHEEAIQYFRQALGNQAEEHAKHFELFPLAKSLDALGRYEEAFQTLVAAHRSQLAHLELTAPLAVARGAPTMAITQYNVSASDVAQWDHTGAPSTADSPIFIVAFPRSGTTLLELTLDAHPSLVSMDEQPFVQNALDDLLACGARYPEELATIDSANLERVRQKYWERVRRKVRLQDGQRLVDKNPLNMLRLPVIHRLFPNARIILAIRHPLDVVLSCYMQHFRAPDFALLCADLNGLARGFCRSFDFWYRHNTLLNAPVREVRYETFVAQFDDQVRSLIEFLELPWNAAVSAPAHRAKAKGYISTPSYSQVVQPVNTKSVGRWRAYEQHLGEAREALSPYLERWSYDG